MDGVPTMLSQNWIFIILKQDTDIPPCWFIQLQDIYWKHMYLVFWRKL